MASTDGAVCQSVSLVSLLATAGLAYSQTLRGSCRLMADIKLSKNLHCQISGNMQRELKLLLINIIQTKEIPGYTFTLHSSRPVDIEVIFLVFVIQAYEKGGVA